jgi:hypothetical protein
VEKTGHLTRRGVLGVGAAMGLGALGATSEFLLGGGGAAAATPPDDLFGPRSSAGTNTTRSISAATPGLSYLQIPFTEFFPTDSTKVRSASLGVSLATAGILLATVPVPTGAILRELSVWAGNTAAESFDVTLVPVIDDASSFAETGIVVSVPPSSVATTQLSSSPLDVVVESDQFWLLAATVKGANSQGIWACRIGYVAPPTFVPIAPARVYDSRSGDGVLSRVSSRLVSVKDARNSSGAVTTADVVPAGATAITFNLTVTGATGPNFLSVGPGNSASLATSNINFPVSDDRANGGVVKLDANRQVKVFNGDQPGSTHFIIDVTGYYF